MTITVLLVDMLSEEEALPVEELERAREYQRQGGGPLAEWLVRRQLISEDELFFLMSRRMGVPAIPEERLLHLTLSPELRRRVPRALAQECVLLPLDLDLARGVLSVVMFDPSDPDTLERLRATSRVVTVRAYLGRRSTILDAVGRVYTEADLEPGTSPDPILAPQQRSLVEVITGKVEIDAGLAEEIASLEGGPDLLVTTVKPISEVRAAGPSWSDEDGRSGAAPHEVADTAETMLPVAAGSGTKAPAGLQRSDLALSGSRQRRWRSSDDARTTVSVQYAEGERLPHRLTGPLPLVELERPMGEAEDSADGERAPPVAEAVEWMTDEPPPLPRVSTEPEGGEHGLDGVERGLLEAADSDQVTLPPALPADVDVLLGELFASIGVLVAMLEERIDPGGAVSREHARLSRLVARDLGYDGLTINRITVAAHLFGLDMALRREVGGERARDVQETFAAKPVKPGGLNPTLRSLGACALAWDEEQREPPVGSEVIRTVSDYLDLRAESDDESSETLLQLMRTGGADSRILEALVTVVEDEETLVETRRAKLTDRHQP